jgi:hypothetical protein
MLRGERNPAEAAYERTPLPEYGKVPQMSTPDPRLPGAVLEVGQLASSFLPFGWARQAPIVAETALPTYYRAPIAVDPATLRFSQTTAGGRGRADLLRASMRERGLTPAIRSTLSRRKRACSR